MPVYQLTYHAYGTWLPDRPEGYDPHDQGHQPPDLIVADLYRNRMQQTQTCFSAEVQQHALQTLITSQPLQRFEMYAFAAEPSHLHAVIAWRDEREPMRVRSQIKSSMTRALNQRFGKRQWFVAKGGHTAVRDVDHLAQLIDVYLTKHRGLYWKRNTKPLGHARGDSTS